MIVPGIVTYFSVGQSWKGCMTILIKDRQNVNIESTCQEEAINESHGPKVNRISGEAVSIQRCL
jgi:hypothetical protein